MAGSKRPWAADMAHGFRSYAAERDRAVWPHGRIGGVARLRDEAWQRFVSVGFPTPRDEEWRFTSVARIAEGAFRLASPQMSTASAVDIDPFRVPGAAAELVFVDGHYQAPLSRMSALPSGVQAGSLAAAIAAAPERLVRLVDGLGAFDRKPFVALNAAFLDDGAWIELADHAALGQPIHLLFYSSGEFDGHPVMAHPRVVVRLGANSQASVVETYGGPEGTRYFTNAVTEIILGENAALDHYRLEHEGPDAFHMGAIQVQAQRSATYASHGISLGGALVRNELTAVLDGEGAACSLNGLYASDGERLVDNHTTIDHARPHCGSREIYKGILAERGRGVFNGKIIVRPDAQKTDAKQTNRALLLSEDARINTKPQLEIFANDVRCTHGAAVGQLDEEALFYLRSRGLSDRAARRLLIHAFAVDVLNRMTLEPVRAAVEARLHRQLLRVLPKAA